MVVNVSDEQGCRRAEQVSAKGRWQVAGEVLCMEGWDAKAFF